MMFKIIIIALLQISGAFTAPMQVYTVQRNDGTEKANLHQVDCTGIKKPFFPRNIVHMSATLPFTCPYKYLKTLKIEIRHGVLQDQGV